MLSRPFLFHVMSWRGKKTGTVRVAKTNNIMREQAEETIATGMRNALNDGRDTSEPTKFTPQVKTCNRCGEGGLRWEQVDEKWRLFSGQMPHNCRGGSQAPQQPNQIQPVRQDRARLRAGSESNQPVNPAPADRRGVHVEQDGARYYTENRVFISRALQDGAGEFPVWVFESTRPIPVAVTKDVDTPARSGGDDDDVPF